MAGLIDDLRARGADMNGAMDRFLGDQELYGDCFRMFLEDPSFPALEHALSQQDAAAAFDAAHSLKGVAGNLGLTALYQAVCALVEPLRQGQCTGLSPLYQAVRDEKAKLDALLR